MKIVLTSLIRAHQLTLSPILRIMFGKGCRFTPTCSNYTIEAVEKYGALKGLLMGVKRFSKCRPFGTSGYDPVPSKI